MKKSMFKIVVRTSWSGYSRLPFFLHCTYLYQESPSPYPKPYKIIKQRKELSVTERQADPSYRNVIVF